MLVNADFSQPATVAGDDYQWVASPQSGVERVMLDRLGGERARATSIVRYAPRSFFPRHFHPGGEEIFVLSGTFSEDGNHYPAGYYLRNPPGSSHQPSSHEGAVIFVKLWQMQPDESASVRIDTRDPDAWRHVEGRALCPLFENDHEQVRLERLSPGQAVFSHADTAAEVLVIGGQISTPDQSLGQGSWVRLPAGVRPVITSGAQGATLFIKTGHLPRTLEYTSP
ncbi:cupin domain-containing protein [Pseudomonas sp. 22-AL-CL-001]|uniref:cupin domain-containing protein n=1 Tax=Pseudomonas alabamensis TaxID=3064349 RepID=UPI002713DECE|nr:cupin domain-containing protein [Pseudomonas sp. 22-AL-CL-001]MDO7911223.1 cupin domain-containing protein [Pseudomonas sp. 22-AL-CL-001]